MRVGGPQEQDIPEHCMVLDGDGHVVISNAAMRVMLADFASKDGAVSLVEILTRLGARPDRAAAMQPLLEAARQGQSLNVEVPIERGGETRICAYMMMPVGDSAGRSLVAVLGRDVTARQALADERQIFFSLVEASSDFIGVGDAEGRPVYVNPAGRRMVGLSLQKDVRETEIAEFYPEELRDFANTVILKEMEATGRWAGETYFRNFETNERIPVSDTHFMVRHPESGRLLGHATITRDISGMRQTEEALRLANRRKDEFIAALGHELRNPIAALSAAVDFVEHRGDDPATVARFRELFRRQLKTLVRLVDDLLDVSRISRGKLTLVKQRLKLDKIVRDALLAIRHAAESQGCDVVFEDTLPGREVMGDATRLEQVFVNLLTNAIRHSARGSRIAVKVAKSPDDAHVVVSVADNGAGIAPEMLPHIFEPFVQGAQSLDRPQGGLGIGLTLVRSLIELHGGHVEARSAGQGAGSVFQVHLPLAAPEHVAGRMGDGVAGDGGARKRIVIVEDNEDARALLADLLRDMGHEAHEARDGAAGLTLIRETRPDLALVDIGLPKLDGFALAEQLRSDPDHQSIALFAVTGYGGAEMVARARAAGFDGHLTKPLTLNQVQALLEM